MQQTEKETTEHYGQELIREAIKRVGALSACRSDPFLFLAITMAALGAELTEMLINRGLCRSIFEFTSRVEMVQDSLKRIMNEHGLAHYIANGNRKEEGK